MSHEIPLAPTTEPPTDAAPPAVQAGPLRRWLRNVAALLDRAEQRITENFRVPPGGG
ncbi:MAG: hypothetical protein ACN6O3_06470 [Comamonas sp.]